MAAKKVKTEASNKGRGKALVVVKKEKPVCLKRKASEQGTSEPASNKAAAPDGFDASNKKNTAAFEYKMRSAPEHIKAFYSDGLKNLKSKKSQGTKRFCVECLACRHLGGRLFPAMRSYKGNRNIDK